MTVRERRTMANPIEFYFDFSSPYSYLASEIIEPLATRYAREVDYKPMLLGAAFKVAGTRPLTEVPLKGEYSKRDMERSARLAGIAFALPEPFPIGAVAASRAYVWLSDTDPLRARAFLHATFREYFVAGRNIAESSVVTGVLRQVGADPEPVLAAIQQAEIKERLKALVDAALARGVFGAPFLFVDGEPFWGHDRLAQVERWLATGPF
jgi:2-hydroxychromene-2-carboxylate isomerase